MVGLKESAGCAVPGLSMSESSGQVRGLRSLESSNPEPRHRSSLKSWYRDRPACVPTIVHQLKRCTVTYLDRSHSCATERMSASIAKKTRAHSLVTTSTVLSINDQGEFV